MSNSHDRENQENKNMSLLKESFLDNKIILVTGGAGFIGRNLVKKVLDYNPQAVRALDINENGLQHLRRELQHPRLRTFLGSIRDKGRLKRAIQNVDVIIHLGAYKHVDLLEVSPFEAVKTNVLGTENLIECAIDENVEKVLNVSTDKSTLYTSIYGATKFLAEKLTLEANNWKGDAQTILANARPVNVLYSDGSVYPYWQNQKTEGKPLSITHPDMERFFLTVDETVKFLLKCIELMKGGETFVPSGARKIKIIDLAKQMSDKIEIVGIRKGERLTELLFDPSEIERAQLVDGIWVIHS